MRFAPAAALAVVLLTAGTAGAETLGELLRSRGLTLPAGGVSGLEEPVGGAGILDDEREVLVVTGASGREPAGLRAILFTRSSRAWKTAMIAWSQGALPMESCRGGLAVERFLKGFLVRAHINPSAECTIVLGKDLGVRAVLAGWPVARFADGRIVYQRNQVHFASFHPVALALFDPRGPSELDLYPRRPYQPLRLAHVSRTRAVLTDAWCRARNHPCDPELFDEHVSGDVAVDARGDALALAVAWDNTAGWSDAERWGRLEPFREVRRALAGWDGRGAPPSDLYEALASGLARTRNLAHQASLRAALAGWPAIGDLVVAALGQGPSPSQDPRSWLVGLDPRWAEAPTWRELALAVAVPEEFTEVVCVYTGLGRPDTIRYRELLRREFEARFGNIPLRRALDPDILQQIFGSGTGIRKTR